MKKILITLNLIFLFIFIVTLKNHSEPYKCATQFTTFIEKENNYTLFDGTLTLFIESEHGGFFNITGMIKTKDNGYFLSRQSYFTFKQNKFDNVKMTKITKTVVQINDRTPEKIWEGDILPGSKDNEFPVEFWRLKNNLVLLKSIDSGYFICPRIDW
ncbi:hypothetical protein P4S07_024775 [Serratia marcescens]|uniref:hypothetical protein n=1 Tax=Serratia marcescens TaxID=615 RepID=UPI0024053A6B|nr:hypothetical protein [Serratia marcescens]MDF9722957.1 hypothetical protein [Serratia marcescens]